MSHNVEKQNARSNSELLEALEDQRAAMRSSMKGYDEGNFWEAPRLATAVYNLVNDGQKKTRSILSQLGLRSSMGFFSTIRVKSPGEVVLASFGSPLASAMITTKLFDKDGNEYCKTQYEAFLGGFPTPARGFVKFAEWWNEIIFVNKSGAPLSRHKLAYHLRSQDGGSHFDAELPTSTYTDFKDADSMNAVFAGSNGGNIKHVSVKNGHLATMRQMAWELDHSLDQVNFNPE